MKTRTTWTEPYEISHDSGTVSISQAASSCSRLGMSLPGLQTKPATWNFGAPEDPLRRTSGHAWQPVGLCKLSSS